MIQEIISKYRFDKSSDRIGPDCPFTHWKLYFKSSMVALCQKKFSYFGKNAEFRPGAYAICCSKISIGDNVIIRPGTMLFSDPREGESGFITIEENVMIGSGVHMYVHNHRYNDPHLPIIAQGHYPSESITLKKGCWIGANTIILPGVTVGENSVIGAGSVVTHNIPPFSIAIGSPARIIKKTTDA